MAVYALFDSGPTNKQVLNNTLFNIGHSFTEAIPWGHFCLQNFTANPKKAQEFFSHFQSWDRVNLV